MDNDRGFKLVGLSKCLGRTDRHEKYEFSNKSLYILMLLRKIGKLYPP